MKKLFWSFILLTGVTFLSGCAVIDFLDGRHLDQSRDREQPRYEGGYGSSNSGGHSH